MVEKSVNWKLILKLRKFKQYLGFDELKQISKLCSLVYFNYKPITLSKLIINQDFIYNLTVNTKFTENPFVDLLYYQCSVESISHLIRAVYVHSIDIYTNFHSLFLPFSNIKQLTLSRLQIDLPILIKSLSNLGQLEVIKFNELKVYINDSLEPCSYGFTLPLSLKELEITNVFWVLVFGGKNTQTFLIYQRDLFEKGPFINCSKTTYIRLKTFKYCSQPGLGSDVLNNFLTNNPHLKHLEVETELLNNVSFTLISRLSKLTNLSLLNNHGGINLTNAQLPVLNTIQQLSIYYKNLTGNFGSISVLTSNCSNITQLSIQYYSDYNNDIERIINSLPHLSQLILSDPYKNQPLSRLSIANPSITILKLSNFPLTKLNSIQISNLPKLIYIQIESFSKNELDQVLNNFENFTNFKKFNIFNGKIKIYKY